MAAVLVTTAACGSSNTTPSSSSSPPTYTAGTYPPSSSLINQCATPRTGNDPVTGTAYPDQPGSTMAENMFLRSWTNELYLWYHEVPDTNPAGYATADYFNLLKTSATTPSGHPKDKFHFTYVTTDWESLSQSGVSAGYGAQFAVVAGSPPRQVVVAFTDPNTPATAANLARGAEILTVDGVDVVNGSDTTTLNNGLFPTAAGQTHSFSVQDLGSSAPRTISMTSANVTETPVQNVTTIQTRAGNVGYMLFNDHIATAEQLLVNGFTQLSSSGVSDLVLDIRYNGGGYLDIASEVAYMIAGPGPTTGKTFDRTVFNDKYPNTDPVQNQPLTPTPFHNTAQGFSVPNGQALPSLNLSRVTVLTSSGTCSASEAIINSLRGVGIEVIQVGSTTCGKPYGFYPQPNCGTTYFSIQFQGLNNQGFGDYPDGFSPANGGGGGVSVPGCGVADDYTHALGDPNEARLAAALGYLADGSCPAASASAASRQGRAPLSAAPDGELNRGPWRENRILRRPH